ncbi:23S rRNA methyltransferase [Streptomyces malaysiensis subsp. malaysiensis]|uniref:putative RNA methyltransferase n=1 Tax=Streptomyces malaysiensis TaxID=92644 RepID=UPI000BFCE3DA|nr:methyltransferase domain-containing protein [Streptomyces malaysiensis]QDL74314.1 23S rRNA methyltransferase [Streptomyces malaysiensis]
MRKEAVRYLRCPHCSDAMAMTDGTLRCPLGHSFDVAKQGYVNLLPAAARFSADTAAMVAARADFLAAGHYAPIAEALAALARATAPTPTGGDPGCVVDIGGGTGYHHARVMAEFPGHEGILLDISKFAARRAARAHPRISAVVADAWDGLPIADGAASVVLNVFAPRNPAELRRILRPEGVLLVVTPRPDHLRELVEALGLLRVDEQKDERLADRFSAYFTEVARERSRSTMALDHKAVPRLVGMGPNAWHQHGERLEERIASLPEPCEVTVSITLTAYRPLI